MYWTYWSDPWAVERWAGLRRLGERECLKEVIVTDVRPTGRNALGRERRKCDADGKGSKNGLNLSVEMTSNRRKNSA